jgi:putative transcriptional regulator
MTTTEFLAGQILVSQPKNSDGHFAKSIVLIAQHSISGAWGVVVNRPALRVNMQAIMLAAGIEYSGNEVIYVGGPVEPTRVHVVHSMDWFSGSTLKITDEIGITGDVSVLAAISQGQGPKLYRAGVGLAVWSAGQLEGEQSGLEPWTASHKWLTTNASIDLCLTGAGEEQWQRCIDHCVSQRVSSLF